MTYTLSRITLYPVKSLGGLDLQKSAVEARGLRYDRRWMIVDERQQFVSQREYTSLTLVRVEFDPEHPTTMTWSAPGQAPFTFSCLPQEQASSHSVQVWRSTCNALDVGDEPAAWLTAYLGTPCRLVYMPDSTRRSVNPQNAVGEGIVSFADGYPILLVGHSSLEQLNQNLEHPISMRRFRPNLVVEGAPPHAEDEWTHFTVGEVSMRGVKNCDRCQVITIDPETATQGKEPLTTLSTYRKRDGKVWFGQNLIPLEEGTLRVGDTITLSTHTL
ncbi:MAG: MOSC domain-containing protein [Deltaproteobacteria bacterium]|nr:MAG: MOSC domain-containing protein [Deltaproteobacteria bacterium]